MKRLFRGLRRPPDPSYDAVVIGAGIGGLVTANLLARDGAKVLLVEQHYMVGGYCSTFRRGGYLFDAATHFYPLLGNPETFTGRLLLELGVETKWIRMDPVDVFHLPDGARFEVPVDLASYLAQVKAWFPAEAAALDAFFKTVREAYAAGLIQHFRGRPVRQAPWSAWTVRDALDHFFEDPRLKLLLTADCAHWGSPPQRTSFVFDSMLRLAYFLGNYYPVGGSQAFADELARTFEERGGHVLMSTRATRIAVEDGRAAGVDLEILRGPARGAAAVRAGAVISNADLRRTVRDLLAGETATGWVDPTDGLRASFPCFLAHLGLEGMDRDALERAQGYYWNDWDPDRVGQNGLRCKIFVPTLLDPTLAPPGGDIVILQKVLDPEMFAERAARDPEGHRACVENYVVDHLDAVLPGAKAAIRTRTSATAWTSERFTMNLGGAMLGWEMSPGQVGAGRPAVSSPVDRLWLVGHWTRPGGGITPVIASALEVAALAREGIQS
jgi:phytoene dehydrogenase-like protein